MQAVAWKLRACKNSLLSSMKLRRLCAPSTMLTGLQRPKPVQSDAGLQVTAGLTGKDRKTCSNIHHLESAVYLKCISLKCVGRETDAERGFNAAMLTTTSGCFPNQVFILLFSMIIKTKFWMTTIFQWHLKRTWCRSEWRGFSIQRFWAVILILCGKWMGLIFFKKSGIFG